jgi:predicted lysophospholipase L1 biosynthesis ABC-type transport system permease subunit
VADRFPLDDGRLLVVADLGAVQQRESAPVRPNTVLVSGEPGLAGRLEEIVAGTGQPHQVLDRRRSLALVQASPFVGSTRDLVALMVPAAVLYALLATVLALVLAAPARRRDATVLRRLGATSRESLRLVLTEHAPLVLGMLLGGVVAGLGLVRLALGAVDLSPLTGGVGPPDVHLPLLATALLTGGLLFLVATTTALVSVAERQRPDAGRHDGGER